MFMYMFVPLKNKAAIETGFSCIPINKDSEGPEEPVLIRDRRLFDIMASGSVWGRVLFRA